MRTTTISVAVALLAAALSLSAAADGDEKNAQSGDNSDCLDFNVLWEHPGVHSPLAAFVDVTGDTPYTLTSSSGTAYVDFYNDAGGWVGWSAGASGGTTPLDATYGTVCVVGFGSFPGLPEPLATWTYTEN